ncbi:hypothetical protein D6D03_08817 [Aureobasidium pullulans]|nr:hypothetical protein D6D03_08817 [Aureobasidium pullulans]
MSFSSEIRGQPLPHNTTESHDIETGFTSKDDVSLNTVPVTKSIYSFHEKCIRNYENLLLALESENLYAKRLPAGTIVEAKDEYSRLRIWGEQTYAVLPQKARRSLDAQLRDDEETKNIITGTLKRLSDHITRAGLTLKATKCIISDQAADDAYVSSSSSDGSQPEQDNIYGAKAEKGLAAVYGGITSLYRIAALLRRPRITNKYLKSRNRRVPINLLVSSLDYTRITDKVRFWRGYMTDRVAGDDELGVTENDLQLRRELGDHQLSDIEFLCQRLTRANTLRREQFDYWTEHPDVPESYRLDDTLRSQGTATTPSRDESSKEVLDRSKAAAPRSVFSTSARTTFSSVGHTTIQDDRTRVSRPRTRYAASNVAGSNATRVPDIPRCPPEETEFECPFCHTELDWAKMQDRTTWKRHVFRDLRPYVCTFENCHESERLFVTRHDWICHEQQMHRRRWICPEGCTEDSNSKAAIVEHIRKHHSSGLEEHQISIVADMCEREIDVTEWEQCLICLKKMSLHGLQQHLATHLEEIALFILPIQADEDQTESGNNSATSEYQILLELANPQIETVNETSLAASIVELLNSGLQLTQACDKFASFNRVPTRRIEAISREINLILQIVQRLHTTIEDDTHRELVNDDALRVANDAIVLCQQIFDALQSLIPDVDHGDTKARLIWSLRESKLELLGARLNKAKSTLHLLMNVIVFAAMHNRSGPGTFIVEYPADISQAR